MHFAFVVGVGVTVVVLLGGCLNESDDSAPASHKIAGSTTEPVSFQISACQHRLATMAWPGSLGRGSAPEQWKQESTYVSENVVLFFLCERVNIGLLERGPVVFIADAHTKISIPDDCRTESNYQVMIEHFFVDDIEVATTVNAELLLSTIHAAAVRQIDELPMGEILENWQWTPDGYETSSVNFRYQRLAESQYPTSLTMFWDHGSGIGMMTINGASTTPIFDAHAPALGTMKRPMLAAGTGNGNSAFAGVNIEESGSYQTEINMFGDYSCKTDY